MQDGVPSKGICTTGKFVYIYSQLYSILMIVFLDMDKSDRGCNILLEKTAAALDGESLQMLLIIAQEKNIMLCIQYAVK